MGYVEISTMNSAKNYEGHRIRLRQRFIRSGLICFAEYEIIELFLTLCLPRGDVKPLAKALLHEFRSIRAIFDASIDELAQIKGMGTVAPVAVQMIKSFAEIYLRENIPTNQCIINNYEQLEKFWRLRLGSLRNEVFEVALLNTHLGLLKDGVIRLEEGVVNRTNAYPRKIMEYALQKHASAFIIAHNHPSGSVWPSDNDRILTRKIEEAAESLELYFIDHVIVAHREIFSFRKEKIIQTINSTW
ncbi:MAG: DNA repair protein RadC [Puniceicoccales bacterium]|jgi:DNA repair protein RadC|nr:DNA repair protein RadC [Puniceicoccales bacterium]